MRGPDDSNGIASSSTSNFFSSSSSERSGRDSCSDGAVG